MTQAIALQRPRPTAKFAKIYAGTWTLLAALALAYMITLAVQPSIIADWTPGRAEPDAPDVQRTVARFATDIGGLKQTVGEIQRDMSALRTAVLAASSRDKELFERLAHVEERTKPQVTAELTAPKAAAPRPAEPRGQKAPDRAAAAQATTAPKAAPAAPAPEPAVEQAPATPRVTVLNAPPAPASPIATGSIMTPPAQGLPAPPPTTTTTVAFGPGAIKAAAPTTSAAAVELASGPSLDALRLNWSLLAERHASSLRNLEARYTNAGEGQPYQLVAGPIATPEEAARVCAELKAKRVACRVTGFAGNAL